MATLTIVLTYYDDTIILSPTKFSKRDYKRVKFRNEVEIPNPSGTGSTPTEITFRLNSAGSRNAFKKSAFKGGLQPEDASFVVPHGDETNELKIRGHLGIKKISSSPSHFYQYPLFLKMIDPDLEIGGGDDGDVYIEC